MKCQLECSSLHFYVFINPVLWIWPQVLIHIIMDVFMSPGMTNPGLTLVSSCDVIETMIALSAVARNSAPFALILLWGLSKTHVVGGGSGSPPNIVLGPSQPLGSQPLLHLLQVKAGLIQKYECFSSASSSITL